MLLHRIHRQNIIATFIGSVDYEFISCSRSFSNWILCILQFLFKPSINCRVKTQWLSLQNINSIYLKPVDKHRSQTSSLCLSEWNILRKIREEGVWILTARSDIFLPRPLLTVKHFLYEEMCPVTWLVKTIYSRFLTETFCVAFVSNPFFFAAAKSLHTNSVTASDKLLTLCSIPRFVI